MHPRQGREVQAGVCTQLLRHSLLDQCVFHSHDRHVNAGAEFQRIVDKDGRPAFIVLPYDEFRRM